MRGPTESYVLVRASRGVSAAALEARLAAELRGTTVQTREQFSRSESRIVTDMSADLLRLMSSIGLVIALAVIALSLLTSTLARVRDYAVLKALGASTPRLAGTVVSQVVWIVALGLGAAGLLAVLLARTLPSVAPTVQLVVTSLSVIRLGVGALAIGTVAALMPLQRLASVDAATAFKESR
jgi:putative ABC transport system permease protein